MIIGLIVICPLFILSGSDAYTSFTKPLNKFGKILSFSISLATILDTLMYDDKVFENGSLIIAFFSLYSDSITIVSVTILNDDMALFMYSINSLNFD